MEREFICLLEPGDYSPEQLDEFKKQGIIGPGVTIESNPVLILIEVKD